MAFCNSYITVSGVIQLCLGLAIIGYSIYVINDRGEDFTSSDAYNWQQMFVIIAMSVGGLLFLSGIFGTCGGSKQKPCCIATYKFFNYFLIVIFLALGAISLALLYLIGSDIQNTQDCYDNKYVGKTGKYDLVAQKMFCTKECPCYVSDDKKKLQMFIGKNYVFSNNSEDKNIRKCNNFNKEVDKYPSASSFLSTLENNFNCAGFCQKHDFFMFSNINNKVSEKKFCAQVIGEEIEKNFFVYMIVCFAIAFLLIMGILATCCFSKKSKEDKYKEPSKQVAN